MQHEQPVFDKGSAVSRRILPHPDHTLSPYLAASRRIFPYLSASFRIFPHPSESFRILPQRPKRASRRRVDVAEGDVAAADAEGDVAAADAASGAAALRSAIATAAARSAAASASFRPIFPSRCFLVSGSSAAAAAAAAVATAACIIDDRSIDQSLAVNERTKQSIDRSSIARLFAV